MKCKRLQCANAIFTILTRVPRITTAAIVPTAIRPAISTPSASATSARRSALIRSHVHVVAIPAAAATSHPSSSSATTSTHPTSTTAAAHSHTAATATATAAVVRTPRQRKALHRAHARFLHGAQLLVNVLLLLAQLFHLLQMRQMVLEQDDRIADALGGADEHERHLAVLARNARMRLVLALDLAAKRQNHTE